MTLPDKADEPTDGLMADERRSLILQIIETSGRARVRDLARRFNTSSVTIRNDLNELEKRGLLLRSHGGAAKPDAALSPGNETKVLAFLLCNRGMLHNFHSRIFSGAEEYCAVHGWEIVLLSYSYSLYSMEGAAPAKNNTAAWSGSGSDLGGNNLKQPHRVSRP